MLDDAPALDPLESDKARRTRPDTRKDGGGVLAAAAVDSLGFQRLEDAGIWTRAWVAIGFAAEIAQAGGVLPFTVGNHGIHVERMGDGSLVGRFNKAQHGGCRAVPLQCQTGARTRCSFTACGYSYDRRPIAAADPDRERHLDQYLGLRPERLLQVDVRQWGPLLLARLDPRREARFDWVAPERILPSGGFERGHTAWQEFQANWKQAAVAFASADELGGRASLLYPNVVVRTSPDDSSIVILQPVALGRTLCRIRTWSGHSSEALSGWIADRARLDASRAGGGSLNSGIGQAFERRARDDVERLTAEPRSDVLFQTVDEGGW